MNWVVAIVKPKTTMALAFSASMLSFGIFFFWFLSAIFITIYKEGNLNTLAAPISHEYDFPEPFSVWKRFCRCVRLTEILFACYTLRIRTAVRSRDYRMNNFIGSIRWEQIALTINGVCMRIRGILKFSYDAHFRNLFLISVYHVKY